MNTDTPTLNDIQSLAVTPPPKFDHMRLKIYIADEKLKTLYEPRVAEHNSTVLRLCDGADAGFDLFVTEQPPVVSGSLVAKYDFGIKCSAEKIEYICSACGVPGTLYSTTKTRRKTGYYMYPRSSLSKTRLRLANSVGIIDAGYRGTLQGAFDVQPHQQSQFSFAYSLPPPLPSYGDRLVQICAPGLLPILVTIVDTADELGPVTERGEGGFGSTDAAKA